MAEASGYRKLGHDPFGQAPSAQAGGECAATQQLAEVGDQGHHVEAGRAPDEGDRLGRRVEPAGPDDVFA